MKKIILMFAALVLVGIAPACKGRSPVLVSVGSTKIREGDLDLLARVNPRLKARLSTPAGRQSVLENFVEQELLYQESRKRGLHRKGDVKDKLALYRKVIIAQALIEDELENKIREYYDAHKDEFERVKVAHILIAAASSDESGKPKKKKSQVTRSEQEALKLAESVRDRIVKGEDFAKVAGSVSEDTRTKKKDGELGYITIRDRRLERWGWLPVAEKAFAMQTGEVSEPVKSKEGYHLVKVLEDKQTQSFEEAEGAIRFKIQADVRKDLIAGLKKKAKVTYAKAEKKGAAEEPQPSEEPATGEPPAAEPAPEGDVTPKGETPPEGETAPQGDAAPPAQEADKPSGN